MTIKDIISGESKNVEFKVALPEKSIKYMKSVVAFANCNGGKILFGIEDDTCKVVGIDDENVFKTMDAITNAISDSCEPAIYPDISLQTIEDKTIIVVEISAGKQRPYYIKSMGKVNGVFVRISGTSRPADEYMIKELLFEGSNRSFDQTICLGMDITDDDIAKLCSSMKQTALKNCRDDEERASVKDVTVNQLISWGIVLERDGKYVPTNAFALLTGNDILPTATQCGMFKGTTKANFIDRREYSGPIQDQAEEALRFVLRNIHMGAEFSRLSRQDIYEIPVESIRELLLNAVIHRSYLDHSNIHVAIYDDRLEVTSPGKLPMGQNIERMKEGYSKIRNEAIAYAFSYMKLMEHWGSGIPRIIDRVVAAGLREPEFIDGDVDLRINIYRKQNGDIFGDIVTKNVTIDTNEAKLIALITSNPTITQAKLANEMNVTTRTVKRILSKLQADGVVRREGTNRSGKWITVGRQEQ